MLPNALERRSKHTGWVEFLFHFCEVSYSAQLIIAQESKSDLGEKQQPNDRK